MSDACSCPYCGAEMCAIETPCESSWAGETHHVCFNDVCDYFVNSWNTLVCQGVDKTGYRCRIDARGACGPIPVRSADDLKHLTGEDREEPLAPQGDFLADDFTREDESSDEQFYQTPRFVSHLDENALATVEDLYVRMIPKGSRILDLMSGPDSHLKNQIEPIAVTGLGLNCEELEANSMLTERVIHDLNCCPDLPFADNAFDVVINTVSVDYLTRPVETFREVARILKPAGLFIVVFSSRMFPQKAVTLWKKASESKRMDIVRKYFALSGSFSVEGYFESKGKPRPQDDKYYSVTSIGDPVFSLWGTVRKEDLHKA